MSDFSLTVIVATYGDRFWPELAKERALPSVYAQGAETLIVHLYQQAAERHEIRNRLAELAVTEWLCFLDADDMLAPGFVGAMREAAPSDGQALLNPAVAPLEHPERAALYPPVPLHQRNFMVIGTLIRREFFLELGGFRDLPFYEDWELWIRAVKAGADVRQVPKAVYLVGTTPYSRDRNAPASERAACIEAVRLEHYPEIYSIWARRRRTRTRR